MEFKYPYVLCLIPFFLLLFWYLVCKKGLVRKYAGHSGARSGKLDKLGGFKLFFARLPNILLVLAVLAGIVAAAWPLGQRTRKEIKKEVHNIKIVLDVSGSMRGGSLRAVVEIAKDFVRSRKGDLIGIVPFDDEIIESYVISSTTDTEYLEWGLERLAFYGGGTTAIGEGLFRAITDLLRDSLSQRRETIDSPKTVDSRQIKDDIHNGSYSQYTRDLIKWSVGPMKNAASIVFTDSGNNDGIDPIPVLMFYRWMNVRAYAVRVDVVEDKIFQEAIRRTGGEAYNARNFADVARFFQKINELEKREEVVEIVLYRKPVYYWPLCFSIGFLVLFIILEFVYLKNP